VTPFLEEFTRPHLDRSHVLCFGTVPQPLTRVVGEYICNHVMVNVCTTEVQRILVPRPVAATSTSIDSLVSELRRLAPGLLEDAAVNDVLAYTRRLMQDNGPLSFAAAMTQLQDLWTRASSDNPSLHVACDPALLMQLFAQKAAFSAEKKRLKKYAPKDEQLSKARTTFLRQVQAGLARTPYYPDVMLRRLLLRCFAEGWIPAAGLAGLFTQSLSLTSIELQHTDFSNDDKPRAAFAETGD
jgi:hypothetical protein